MACRSFEKKRFPPAQQIFQRYQLPSPPLIHMCTIPQHRNTKGNTICHRVGSFTLHRTAFRVTFTLHKHPRTVPIFEQYILSGLTINLLRAPMMNKCLDHIHTMCLCPMCSIHTCLNLLGIMFNTRVAQHINTPRLDYRDENGGLDTHQLDLHPDLRPGHRLIMDLWMILAHNMHRVNALLAAVRHGPFNLRGKNVSGVSRVTSISTDLVQSTLSSKDETETSRTARNIEKFLNLASDNNSNSMLGRN